MRERLRQRSPRAGAHHHRDAARVACFVPGDGCRAGVGDLKNSTSTGASALIFTLWLTPGSARCCAFGSASAIAAAPFRSFSGLFSPLTTSVGVTTLAQ